MVKAATAYGKSGEHNGVNYTSGSTNEASAKDEALGTKDSPDGVLFNCTFNTDHLQGDALTKAVIHIGMHIADLRKPAPGTEGAPAFILEYDGWMVTAISAVTSGQKYLTLPGAYQLWNISWPEAERGDKMKAALTDFLSNEATLSR